MPKLLNGIDTLAYGNLNIENIQYLEKKSIFDNYFDLFIDNPFPNAEETQKEIEFLMKLQEQNFQKPNWRAYKKFVLEADDDIKKLLYRKLRDIGIDWSPYKANILEEIQEECGSLVMRLKQHYQRPRPFQFSYYSGQDFHPFNTISGNSPAYPSGHAFQSRFLLKIVAYNFPEHKENIKKLSDDIAFTRLSLGVHYPSDNKFGFEIADKISTYPQIRDKYFTDKLFK